MFLLTFYVHVGREKNLVELKKWANINDKETIVDSSKSSMSLINVKENADVSSPISNENLTNAKNLINQYLPIFYIIIIYNDNLVIVKT